MTLDHAIQLHEILEIHYYVDHYSAQLYTLDGNKLILIGRGETVEQAISNLKIQLLSYEQVQELRQLPGCERSW